MCIHVALSRVEERKKDTKMRDEGSSPGTIRTRAAGRIVHLVASECTCLEEFEERNRAKNDKGLEKNTMLPDF